MSGTAKQKISVDAELWRIAETGDVDALARVFSNGANVNSRNKHGMTALMKAASQGHARMVRALLARGADPNLVRNDKFSALALAAFFGHTETIRILIEHGASSEVVTRSGTSAKMWATSRTFVEAARCLESSARKPAPIATPARARVPVKTSFAFRIAAVVVVSITCAIGVMVLRGSQARSLPVEVPAVQPAVAPEVSAPVKVENTVRETTVEREIPVEPKTPVREKPTPKVALTRQTRPRAIPEEQAAKIVQTAQSTEEPAAAPVIAIPKVEPRKSPANKPTTGLSPQLITPAKSAPPKGKVIQWP
jgi:hypothetical protein